MAIKWKYEGTDGDGDSHWTGHTTDGKIVAYICQRGIKLDIEKCFHKPKWMWKALTPRLTNGMFINCETKRIWTPTHLYCMSLDTECCFED